MKKGPEGVSLSWAFFRRTVLWMVLLLAVPVSVSLLGSSPEVGDRVAWVWGRRIVSWVGLFLPFAAFAGGIAGSESRGFRRLIGYASVISLLSIVCLGYLAPHLEFREALEDRRDTAQMFPTGPADLFGLWRLRERVVENSPGEFRPSTEHPLRQPPNWIDYLIHSSFALALFAVFGALLGSLTGTLTSGLSPPVRRNARWAIGFLTAALFFLAERAGEGWVRADPGNSGVLGAWGPMLLPALELAGLYLLIVRARMPSMLSGPPSLDG